MRYSAPKDASDTGSSGEALAWALAPLVAARLGRAPCGRWRSAPSARAADQQGRELREASPGLWFVVSYNPGYQDILKDLRIGTRQRFVGLEFDVPPPGLGRAGATDG